MFQEIITIAQAIERGLTRYFTGKPCKHGHIAERLVTGKNCIECSNIRRRKHKQENPEMKRASDARYRQENKEKRRASWKKYQQKNHGKLLAYYDRYRQENADNRRNYFEDYRRVNKNKLSEYHEKYRKENQDKIRAKHAKRRSAKIQRLPQWFGELDNLVMIEAADLAKRRESVTKYEWHVDHMIPLLARKASGLHCASNIQVIPATLNLQKINKMIFSNPGEWINAM